MSSLAVGGFWVGHTLAAHCLSALELCSRAEQMRSAAEPLLRKQGLVRCPVPVAGLPTLPLPSASMWLCLPKSRINQTKGLNTTSKESDESAFIVVLIFSLVPRYRLAGEREQIGALGTQGVPSVCGWQAGVNSS